MRRGILKVVGREDQSALMPTGAALSVGDVEVQKEDSRLGDMTCVRAWVNTTLVGGSSSLYSDCSTLRSPIGSVESLLKKRIAFVEIAFTVFCGG